MAEASEPTVLGLIVSGQARIERAVTEIGTKLDAKADRADVARLEAQLSLHEQERRRDRGRIEILEQGVTTRAGVEAALAQSRASVWTRREKLAGAVVGLLTLAGIWFGPALATAWFH